MLTDHLTNLKQRVRITVVDPTTRSVQGVLRDGATIPVTVWEVPAAFVWPEVNEQWTVCRQSGMWLLGERIESLDEEHSIEDLTPGQGRVNADMVIDRQGRTFVAIDVSTLADGEVAVWDADSEQFIAGAGGGGGGGVDPHTHPISDVVGLQVALDLKAPLASPTFTGDPKAPTPATGDNDTSVATTAFVKAQGYTTQALLDAHKTSGDHDGRYYTTTIMDAILALVAPVTSPTFLGTPAAPTPAVDDNSTRLATTAWVMGQRSNALPLMDGTPSPGTSARLSRADHVHPTDTSRAAASHTHPQSDVTNLVSDLAAKAPLASPIFTGDPKAPTPVTGDNDTSIATTAFVKAQGYLLLADIAGKADLASPTFTGDPKAPTPATGDNDTSVATTAFVKAQNYAATASAVMDGDAAGGVLSGTYPNPGFAVDMATQAELDVVQAEVDSLVAGGGGHPWANVLTYGAVGDGITDDTSAVLAAVATGRDVYLPAGVYRVEQALILQSGQSIIGDGPGSVLLRTTRDYTKYSTGSDDLAGIRANSSDRFAVRGLRVRFDAGDSTTAFTGNGSTATFSYAHAAGEELFVTVNGQEHFSPEALARGHITAGQYATNGHTHDATADTVTINPVPASGARIRICKVIRTNQHTGIYLQGCTRFTVDDVTVEGLYYDGLVHDSCINFISDHVRVRGVVNRGVYVYQNCSEGQLPSVAVNGYDITSGQSVTSYLCDTNAAPGEAISKVQWGQVRAQHATGYGFSVTGACTGVSLADLDVSDAEFYGLVLQANGASLPADTVIGRVEARDCRTYGVFLTGAVDRTRLGTVVATSSGDIGVYVNGATDTHIGDVTVRANTSHGIRLRSCSRGQIGRVLSQSNGGTGVYIDDSSSLTFSAVESRTNTGKGVYVFHTASTTARIRIASVRSQGNTHGIHIESNSLGVEVDGRFTGNSTANVVIDNTSARVRNFETADVTVQATDAGATLTMQSSPAHLIHTGTLTTGRTVALATTNAVLGDRFKVTRTGAGAFNLTVGSKALATNQWSEHTFNGTAWVLSAFGSL